VTATLRLDDGTLVAAALHLPTGAHRAGAPVLLLPGARGDHAAPHLVAVAEILAAGGHAVVLAALSERPPGIGAAGRSEQATARVPQILAGARRLLEGCSEGARDASGTPLTSSAARWIIGGASFGGRVASMALAAHGGGPLGVAGVLAIAYPLHPPGRPDRLRVEHWPGIDVPMLLLSGDADEFADGGLLAEHVGAVAGGATLVLLPGARHDLSVTARRDPHGRRRAPADSVHAHAGALLAWAAAVSG
jgi:uncharacterized protein